jgi:hypothetical protein
LAGSWGSFLVSMTRAAKATGAYWHDNVWTRMCVHPRYGTWTSFRTLVVFHEEDTNGTNGTNGTSGPSGTTVPPSRHRHRRCPESRHPSPALPAPCLCMVMDGEIANARSIFEYALGASSLSSSDANDGTTTMGYGDTVVDRGRRYGSISDDGTYHRRAPMCPNRSWRGYGCGTATRAGPTATAGGGTMRRNCCSLHEGRRDTSNGIEEGEGGRKEGKEGNEIMFV